MLQISTCDYTMSKTHTLRAVPVQMFVADGYLYYLGRYQYDYNTYILDKIKL